MALQKDTFSISLAAGINNKVDPKVAGPEQTTTLSDVVIDKEGRLQKRFGQSVLPTTVQTSFPNPLTITTGTSKTKVFAHENQLCLQNNGALYSQIQGQSKWQFKGNCMPVEVRTQAIAQGVQFTDVVSVLGVTVAISVDQLYVIEDQTGVTIAKQSVSNLLRLAAFSNAVWAITYSGSNLQAQQVNLSTGAVGSPVTLRTDFSSGTSNAVSVAPTTSASVVGEMAFILYASTSSNAKVVPMNASGSVPALGVLDTGLSTIGSIYIEPTLNPNRLYVAVGSSVASWTFSTSAYSVAFAAVSAFTPPTSTIPDTVRVGQVTLAINPVNNSEIWVFYDTSVTIAVTNAYVHSTESTIYYSIISLSGTVTTSSASYSKGLALAGTPIRDTARATIYLPCVYLSPLAPTLFLVDVLKGKATPQTFVVAKILAEKAALPPVISKLRPITGSSTTYRMTNNGYLVDFSLAPTNAVSHQYIAKTTHLSGGILWAYDGDSIVEHNFLVAPEITQLWIGTQVVQVNVITVGTPSLREKFSITYAPGKARYNDSQNTPYLTINTPQNAYYVWFRVDGTGTNPSVGGRISVPVDILSTDTPIEVAEKVDLALVSFGVEVQPGTGNTSPANTAVYQCTTTGTVTAPAAVNFTMSGPLSAGSYQYTAVYKWTDRNGSIYRSAPSVALTASATAGAAAVFEIWAPAITNRQSSSVSLEIYRTLANSQTAQLVTSLALSDTTVRYAYLETVDDTTLASKQFLYTDGGVLENYNIGACTAISSYKNRLLVSAVDDPTAPYYSRTNVIGEPVNFSAFNQIRLDQDGQPVTGHAQIDDKLVLFKAQNLFVTAGDGSNDLGQGESFQLPLRIPGEFGLSNPNSLVSIPQGLVFQTPTKGIQVLDRGLNVQYIGAPVDDYKLSKVTSAVMTTNYENVVFTLENQPISLVYSYRFGRWDTWRNQQGDSGTVWQNQYVRAKTSGLVYVESTNFFDVDGSNLPISMYMETAWIKLKQLQSFGRFYSATLLGQYLSPHQLSVTLAYDFDQVNNLDAHTFDATTVIGSGGTGPDQQTYQVEISPKRQKCNAIKLMITEVPGTGTQSSAYFNAIDFYVGLKAGTNKVSAVKGI